MVRSSWKPSARVGPIFSPRLIFANEWTAMDMGTSCQWSVVSCQFKPSAQLRSRWTFGSLSPLVRAGNGQRCNGGLVTLPHRPLTADHWQLATDNFLSYRLRNLDSSRRISKYSQISVIINAKAPYHS